MPLGWMIFAIILFAGAMLVLKLSLTAAIGAWGWWVGIAVGLMGIFGARLFDRADAKKRQRDIKD